MVELRRHFPDIQKCSFANLIPLGQLEPSSDYEGRTQYRLSRFVCCRRAGNEMLLESPLSNAVIVLHDWRGLALVGALNSGELPREIAPEEAEAFYQLLHTAGMLTPEGANGEQNTPSLRNWSFLDLLFHVKNRDRPGQYVSMFDDAIQENDILPVVKPPMSDEVIPLYKNDLDQLRDEDLPFTQVLEARRSVRKHGDMPLTAQQLGEFLYRTARIQEVLNGDFYDGSHRPYPSGGALHALEVYPLVHRCDGLEAGLYHYCPLNHHLERLSAQQSHLQALLNDAALMTGAESEQFQVLLIITARFGRVSWKYRSAAMSLILKDVGGLFQTCYLVATAMNLAPCALGVGNSRLFAAATGIDYFTETSVGEFLLGTR